MYKFNKILVGLDQSEMDDQLIKAVCKICERSGSKDIYFLHIIKDFNMPPQVVKEFPDIIDKAIEERRKAIVENVESKFTCEGIKPKFIIKQGQTTKEVMKLTEEHDIDLIILGRKNLKKGGGVVINRLARRAGCSILIIPKNAPLKLERVLVPIDFSPYARMAMEKAVELARVTPEETRVIAQNVYQVPSGYHYSGKTFDEFADIMMENAERDFNKFVKGIDTEGLMMDSVYSLDKDEDITSNIYKTAKNTKCDLIAIGAKGRTSTTALFIGSKAEKLVALDSDVPLLVIRPKGKGAGFLEYVRDL